MSEWISVKDRWPKDIGYYLVLINGIIVERSWTFENECCLGFLKESILEGNPTHWMELPKAPNE